MKKYDVIISETLSIRIDADYVYSGSSILSFWIREGDRKSLEIASFNYENIVGYRWVRE